MPGGEQLAPFPGRAALHENDVPGCAYAPGSRLRLGRAGGGRSGKEYGNNYVNVRGYPDRHYGKSGGGATRYGTTIHRQEKDLRGEGSARSSRALPLTRQRPSAGRSAGSERVAQAERRPDHD
jgi:hypothetical protein